jgi:DNA ligase 1
MKAFSTLLDALSYTPARNDKLALMATYFRSSPDPDRGFALAALTDGLPVSLPVRKLVLDLASAHIDPELFRISRDYVGDTAETLSLIWPDQGQEDPPKLSDIVNIIAETPKSGLSALIAGWLDRMDVNGRWALLKFLSGGLRAGVSARLAKMALAQAFGKEIDRIEQAWHGLHPPYTELFDWLDGKAALPDFGDRPVFRPLMLSHPIEVSDFKDFNPADHQIEWKWDGIRVQVSARGELLRLYSRTGDDISESFPEFKTLRFNATLDGELLVGRNGVVAPFQDLQQRLNRKSVSRKMLEDYPAFIRLYDVLDIDGEDLRDRPLVERRKCLEKWMADHPSSLLDLSSVLPLDTMDALSDVWSGTRDEGIEGLMLKREDSTYVSGRPKGLWWKWKRAALTADCVMIYAQRGSGKRSSFYSDYTFACWDESRSPPELVPVGKAYSGFTDDELKKLDHFVRNNTTQRFGPVRQVMPSLVLEVAFDAIQPSKRHKSGVAMRFPRIARIRWDKPAAEADTVQTLRKLISA